MKSTLLWSYFNQMDFNWVSENSLQIRKYENSSCNYVRTHRRCSHCLHPSRESVASLLRFQGRAQCPQARGSSEAGQPVFPPLHHYLVILKKCPRPSHLPPEATEKAGGHTAPGALRTWVKRTSGGEESARPPRMGHTVSWMLPNEMLSSEICFSKTGHCCRTPPDTGVNYSLDE